MGRDDWKGNETTLAGLRKRLETTDLLPGHVVLLEGIAQTMTRLEKTGVPTIGALRAKLKSAKSLAALASAAHVAPEYLTVLRRALEGWFPKPEPLGAFDWLAAASLERLRAAGFETTEQLHAASLSDRALAQRVGLRAEELADWIALADLSRVQWVSPAFARALVAAGFDSAAKIAGADAEALFEAVVKANEGARFYKGKVGLRDIKRVVAAAGYA